MNEHFSPEDLKRVAERIDPLVKEFCYEGRKFRMGDLTAFVMERVGGYISPESPGRAFRNMKQRGEINYTKTHDEDRKKSMFFIPYKVVDKNQGDFFMDQTTRDANEGRIA